MILGVIYLGFCVIGMGSITACDIISRTIIQPFELPVSLILATVGAVVFITILLRQRNQGGYDDHIRI